MARRSRQGPSKADFIVGSRNYSLSADIDKIIANTEKRMLLVMKQSLINAINEMQTPVSKGGKMRVDTGFLRASGQASLNGMPSGLDRPAEGQTYNWEGSKAEATIGGMQIGAVLYWGWSANYARYREAYDGFLYSTIQRWQQIVDKVIADAKRRFP
jgi:hypothetical protein